MSEFNIDRLRAAVTWAEAEYRKKELGDDSLWDQTLWAMGTGTKRIRKPKVLDGNEVGPHGDALVEVKCGTAYCVAGWVCANEGDKFLAPEWLAEKKGDSVHAEFVIPKGSREAFFVGTRAQELLGITEGEANELFESYNSIEDVKRIARKIARRRGETL